VALALFDLDNTLLADDSDHLWGEFLVEQGLVDGEAYARENDRFYEDYRHGRLDIHAFLRFSLRPLAEHPLDRLLALRERFIEEKIRPVIPSASRRLLARHAEAGDTRVIITATNAFVTQPIAELLGVDDLIATEPEFVDGRYTGRCAGTPCFREGKVERLEAWLQTTGESLEGSWFYSDSHNDLPLLERVDRPVAVDPDDRLREVATARGWPVISLRE